MSIIINKVTTKTGDKGITLGPNCKKTFKNSKEIEFLGNLDELNSFLGELWFYIEEENKKIIKKIQNDLLDIGASFYKQIDINDKYISFLDNLIEEYQKNLAPLSSFLLPIGEQKTIKLHIVRAITRRVERSFYHIDNHKNFGNIAIYLNRLSDIFFILLRNKQETLWENKTND